MFNFQPFLTDYYAIALACVLFLTLVYLAMYYGMYHFRVGRYRRKGSGTEAPTPDEKLPPVSVVLTAHNDEAWLRENLVYLLEQEYPDFEIVVVDYLSSDDTESVLKLLKDYYPRLKVVPFKEDVNLFQGKKYPLSIGIKSAKNDILLLADPDCTPKNLRWLRGMVEGYGPQTQIVLGYCGMRRTKTLFGTIQQYDTLAYGAQYLGSALMGHPYTGSGRNLSYRRSFFFDNGGFISHYDVADGADDLFVYRNATRQNTAVCINDDAVLTTEPAPSLAAWRNERRHRVGTRNRHSLLDRMRESMHGVAALLFWAAAVLLTLWCANQGWDNLLWTIVAAAVALKLAWQIVSFAQLTKRFDGGNIHFAAPLFEIYFLVANTILILLPLYSNRKFKK